MILSINLTYQTYIKLGASFAKRIISPSFVVFAKTSSSFDLSFKRIFCFTCKFLSNNSGEILGGISNSDDILIKVYLDIFLLK